MGSWLTPEDTGWWGARGNTETCSLQGYFFWIGQPGAIAYQIFLALHTMLLVIYGWTPRKFHAKIEKKMHLAIFLSCIILATIPLFYQTYNPECGVCLPAPMPIWCGDWIWGDGSECIRGSPALAEVYWLIVIVSICGMTLFCSVVMLLVYRTVQRQMSQRSLGPDHRRESKRIRRTMLLYTSTFYLCWVMPINIIIFAEPGSTAHVFAYIFLPLQGFFNMLVFIAPKCVKYQREHPGTWLLTAYWCVIFGIGWKERVISMSRRLTFGTSSRNTNTAANLPPSGRTLVTEHMTEYPDDEDDDGIGFHHYNERNNPDGLNDDAASSERKEGVNANTSEMDEVVETRL